jgi:hypothetical protein
MNITNVGTNLDGNRFATINGTKWETIPNGSRQWLILDEWAKEDGNVIPDYKPMVTPATARLINRVQFKSMLALLGKSTDDVMSAIDTVITDPTQNTIAKVKVTDSDRYARNNKLFTILAPSLKLTDAQIDAAWAQAVEI